ncbi:Mn2+/Fe2+ NRAMP family transporter [Weissella beninensis]|nr:divalent metal cation transporter [Periweissella beninensis]MBM7544586.1 Mn2+/Fe2+ NRAMP family transporter [Periweissella beninensis]
MIDKKITTIPRFRTISSNNARTTLKKYFTIWGPGMMVMLADTDAGCLITAAQSGVSFGYAMLLPQLLLIPILYMVQEITLRLGIVSGLGHGALIRDYFGKGWAYLSAITLLIAVIGALVTEFIGIAGVGELFGISKWLTVPIGCLLLVGVAFSGSYRRVEKIGIVVGLAELLFLGALFFIHPTAGSLLQGITTLPFNDHSFVYLTAANIGAVIMPWMIFYQQGAVIDRHMTLDHLKRERRDTAIGTFITQGVMILYIVVFAAASGGQNKVLTSIPDLANVLYDHLGINVTNYLLGASILGGSLVAAIVVALAGTWGISEVLNWPHTLNEPLSKENIGFYGCYALSHIIGAALVLINVGLVSLAVSVEVINALLLPIVLGFLLALEHKVLPDKYRMHGWYKWLVSILSIIVMLFGVYVIGPIFNWW